MFKLELKKKKILLLLSLNKENLATRLSAVLAPYNIKSSEFLKTSHFGIKLCKLQYFSSRCPGKVKHFPVVKLKNK